MANILTVCLNPVIQKTLLFKSVDISEVNRTDEYYTDSSGKGVNVSRVLVQLDSDVTHLTHAGGPNRKHFLHLLKRDGIDCKAVNSKSMIRSCYTLLDRCNKTTTEIVEESKAVCSSCEKKILNKFKRIVSNYDYLIISGSKAPGYSKNVIPMMVDLAKSGNLKVILDIKGSDLINSLKYAPDYIKHNLTEYRESFGTEKSMKKIAEELAGKGTTLIVTDHINPVKFWNGLDLEHIDITNSTKPINTTGCGDAFAAGFAYGLSCEMSLKDAVKKGISCGNMNAEQIRPGVIKEVL